MSTVTVAMVAGEASGDLLAAHLIVALRQHLPNARFVGIGGPKMQREGFDAWWPSEKLAVHGYTEALRHYREIAGIRHLVSAAVPGLPTEGVTVVDGKGEVLTAEGGWGATRAHLRRQP